MGSESDENHGAIDEAFAFDPTVMPVCNAAYR